MRRSLLGWVDPDGLGEIGELRRPLHESLGVNGEGGGEDPLPLLADAIGQAVVNDSGSEESQGTVVVRVVVPGEEDVTEGTTSRLDAIAYCATLLRPEAAARRSHSSARRQAGLRADRTIP